MKFFSLVAGLAVLATEALALFGDVETITSDNWAEMIDGNPDDAWMVVFYADWCPFCESFEKEFAAASKDPLLEGKRIKFGAVDVMANRDLVTKFGIQRSPTVKVFGRDRAAPLDYSGHRKHADVVAYCGDYCTEHDYLVPPPVVEEPYVEPAPVAPKVHYEYNLDHIVKDIASQHDQRVYGAQQDYYKGVEQLNTDLEARIAEIGKEYDQKFNDLVLERKNAIEQARANFKTDVAQKKTDHARSIADWDADAIATIESIMEGHNLNKDLTDFIPSLGKDWLNLSWTNENRREIENIVEKPDLPDLDAGLGGYGDGPYGGYGYDGYGPYGDYGYGDGYGYGGYGYGEAPKAPEAPQNPGYGYDSYGYGGYDGYGYGPQQYGGYGAYGGW